MAQPSGMSDQSWDGVERRAGWDAALRAALDARIEEAEVEHDRRLDTLAEIGRVINSMREIDEILDAIMDHLIAQVGAERGFIMLVEDGALQFRVARQFDRATLEAPEFQISRGVTFQVYEGRAPVLSFNALEDPRYREMPSIQQFGLRAIICVPMRIKEKMIGVIYLDNRLKRGAFEERDLTFVTAFSDQAAIAIDNANLEAERRRIRALFEGYVSSEVLEEILSRPDLQLSGERRVVTVMFLDIRGFTSLSEQMDATRLVARLNAFYAEVGEIIFRHGGTLFTYMGDALMAVFGAPRTHGDDAVRAVRTATEISSRMDALREAWTSAAVPLFEIGIGLCTGEVVAGDVGFSKKREYTVIGDTVNTAARLEKLNKQFGTRIALSESTRNAVGEAIPLRQLGTVEVRGKSEPVNAWTVGVPEG